MLQKRVQEIKAKYGQPLGLTERPTIQATNMQVALYQIELLERIVDLLTPPEPEAVVEPKAPPGEPGPVVVPKPRVKPKAKKKAKKKKK